MTKDQYLMMCEQTKQEIDWEKCPEEIEDFPEVVVTALNIFYSLGDRIFPDVGYIGKDYTLFPMLCSHYAVTDYEKDYLTDIILFLESRQIEASQKSLKAEMERIKRK
jgi:hypothetical protein